MYRRRVGKGGVLALALGHSNRRLGAPAPGRPSVPDRHDSWDMPVYKELIVAASSGQPASAHSDLLDLV